MMLDRPDEEAVEAAVEGRWVLNLAICASDRAVLVRPALLSVSCVAPCQPQRGMLTLSMRCMFFDFPAQLRHVVPPPSAAGIVQLGNVALGLLALCAVLL